MQNFKGLNLNHVFHGETTSESISRTLKYQLSKLKVLEGDPVCSLQGMVMNPHSKGLYGCFQKYGKTPQIIHF